MPDLVWNRREFLNRSAILAAAAALPASARADELAPAPASKSPSERVRVAVVGVRGRGIDHIKGYLGRPDCEIAAICDCDSAVTGKATELINAGQKTPARFEQDFRKLLDDRSIDAVSIATPNHWHALMAVWAMRAGKDVYVEKPATHNVHEGALMVQASRKFARICQVGTQSRSNPGMRAAIDYLHAGKAGPVTLAYGLCYKGRKSIGKVEAPVEPPKTVDYDLWCGPAPMNPVRRKQFHYDWHWQFDFGNGDFGNQGVHEADKARWGLGQVGLPKSVASLGGRFGYSDDGDTPNTQLSLFDYGPQQIVFEVRGLPTDGYKGAKVGNIWFGESGYVVCPNYNSGTAFDRDGHKIAEFKGGEDRLHFDNFLKAVRSRRRADQTCDIAEGHVSAALCHLANISYRLGEVAPLPEVAAALGGNPLVADAYGRMREHLKANKVEAGALGRVGPTLAIDPKAEQFVGGSDVAKANALLFREYRKGYDITESLS